MNLTERQKKWIASVQASLERDTGRSLDHWVAIAKTCPETKPRARLKWFKDNHGLLQNRASYVLSVAFPAEFGSWDDEEAQRDALWKDDESRKIFEAVKAAAEALPDIVAGQRKAYSAWSRAFQFAALRPVKGGTAMLGLALEPSADSRLEKPKNEPWSERLKSRVALASPRDVNAAVKGLIERAWGAS